MTGGGGRGEGTSTPRGIDTYREIYTETVSHIIAGEENINKTHVALIFARNVEILRTGPI